MVELSGAASTPGAHPADWLNLLGVRISAVDIPTTVALVETAIARGLTGYVCIRDVHGIVKCQSDAELKRIHNRAYLVTADGMPVVWALKLAGKQAHRVYGPDLMLALLDKGRLSGMRHFFYGTTPEVLELLRARLVTRYPGLSIVGTFAPPFRDLTPDEEDDVTGRINASLADVVWVGLGTPKQERWMSHMRDRLVAPILVGVGAAFDFHAGLKPQAPRFVQRSGLEWLFRLSCEPRRLGVRYAVAIPSFLGLLVAKFLRLRDYPIVE